MAHEIDYKELIFQKDGLLVVQIKKGFYQLRHHSGAVFYHRCFKSKNVAMQAFDLVLPLYDWLKPFSHFQELQEKNVHELRDKAHDLLDPLPSVEAPNEK